MGLYRDESGSVFSMDDAYAETRGFSPVDPTEEQQIYAERNLQEQNDRGALGAVNAGATGFASGATLGLSDWLLSRGMTDQERQTLASDLEAHPIARAGGEIGGMVVSSLEGMPRTPTGYLSSLVAKESEQGLARGGVMGTVRSLNAMGVEGAAQSAGQYIGHSAIENKEVTAEGMAGALGTGYAFGAGAGGAALGVSKGTVAARRMFSRVMDGELAAKDAASAWSLAREEALQADRATAETLQQQYDAIQTAKREARKYANETASMTQEERIRASGVTSEAGPAGETSVGQTSSVRPEDIGPQPLDANIGPAKGGGQTTIFKRAEEAAGPAPLDEGIAPAEGGTPTTVKKVDYTPEGTKVIPRERVPESGTEVPKAGTELEKQLQGTKAQIDEGKALKDIPASKGNASNEIEKMLAEKKAFDAGEHTGVYNMGPQMPEAYAPTSRAPFSNLRAQLGKKLLPETLADIRHAATSDLLSPAIADREAQLVEALDEIKAARAAMDRVNVKLGEGVTDEQLKMLRADNPTYGGKPSAERKAIMEQLDAAHEDALRNAHATGDGAWLEKADEVEKLMNELPSEKDVYWNLKDDIQIVERYEKAIAKAADVAGDSAHPSAAAIRDGVSEAERDAERKVFDRTTRAVDDAPMYGPEAKTPKERVQYARERQLDAKRNLDNLSGQADDVQADLKKANDKVAAGTREKKAILRTEGKTSKAGNIATGLGVLEMLDVPGMPKVSDLPVVGPILGAYLKFRAIKSALGRKMGRVAATGDARAAVLASRTRDRIARAVDGSLGVAARGTRAFASKAPLVTAVLANRIYDDGLPDAPKGAPIGIQAATRIRELAAYVNTPNAIETDVRRQLRDVTDPDLIAAAEQHRRATLEYLLSTAPKAPAQGMMKTVNAQPSPAESMAFARRWGAINDPAGTWERFEQESAALSLDVAEALRTVYPQLFSQAQQRVMQQIQATADTKTKVPYRTRVTMSLFYQMPLDSSLEPENMKITQSVYERKPSSPAYNPQAPGAAPQGPTAQPSIAQPTNLAQGLTPPLDQIRR